MVLKKIFLIVILIFNSINTQSKVIYEKKNIIITDIDLKIYKEMYLNNYGLTIDNNNALKDLVLINSVITNLQEKNSLFIDKIDKEISNQYGKSSLENSNLKDFLRFIKIRNEFIINYFQNKLDINELMKVFNDLGNLNLPISENNCLLISKVLNLNNNREFIESLFNNIKNNTRNFIITINDKRFQVCIDESTFKSIENILVDYIEKETVEEFEIFVYDKIEN